MFPGLGLFLHLGSYAVALFFDFMAVFVRLDVGKESFDCVFSFALGVHVFIAVYRIGAVVGVIQCRSYAIDSDCCNVFIVDEVGQCYVSDSALGLSNALHQCAGVVGFQGLVGSFFLAAESQFSEECSGAGSGRTGYEDDRFIWAANIFPVGYLSGEYVLQLLFGQGLNSFSDILVDNRCYGQDSDLVVNQVFCFFLREVNSS